MKNHIIHILFLLTFLTALSVQATTITVQSGGAIPTIKRAIILANTGDTILVKAGTYREGNIRIEKTLTLIGENYPTIDGEKSAEVFSVSAHHVTITGFNIMNSGISSMHDLAGVGADKADYLIVKSNRFINTFFAIHISNSSFCTIEDNTIQSVLRPDHENGNGIHLWYCTNATIHGNTITGHRDGIYFEFVTYSLISDNLSEKNLRYGLHFMFSNDDEYNGNIFRDNGAGVAVMFTKNVTMVNNTFEKNWGPTAYGLLLKEISDSRVENNRFIENTMGIYMEGTSRSSFKQNEFLRNGWAVKLQASCDENIFSLNNFRSNTFDLATNGSLVLNTMDKNYWDKYQGYDLNRDGIGDVPFRPVNMYAMIVERIPTAVLLWRSFLVFLLDRAEKVLPAVTPENLKDNYPSMKPYDFNTKA